MTFKDGKYTYKSINHYRKTILKVATIFLICLYLLYVLKDNMNKYVYIFTSLIDIITLIHLYQRYNKTLNKKRSTK